jgi:transcriptional regulator with XRE-family HTH domain
VKISEAVGKRILALLAERNITRCNLAMRSGLPSKTIDYIISNKSGNIKGNTIIKLASGFGMTISEFLNDELFSNENLDV